MVSSPYSRAVIEMFFCVDISEVNYATYRYIIDNIQTHFPFKVTYKIIVCGEKTVRSWSCIIWKIPNYLQNHRLWRKKRSNWYYIIQKIIERSILASHVQYKNNVYIRNELPPGCRRVLMPFNIRVTSCRYELAVIFTCRLCIDIAMSNRHVVSFREYSDNR